MTREATEYAASHTDAEIRAVLVERRGEFEMLLGVEFVAAVADVTAERRGAWAHQQTVRRVWRTRKVRLPYEPAR